MLTPFDADGRFNLPLFCAHAKNVLNNGSRGVTLFGTTGEGASIGLSERETAIAAMIDSGVETSAMTLGLCGSAVPDVAEQVRQGIKTGVTRFLLLPPFYFKGVSDDGLFLWHATLFEETPSIAKFIVYHIPQVTQVPLSLDLITRLNTAFPDRILAVKDSAGQWNNTRALLERGEIPVLVGDERQLHKAAAMGGAGSICGLANLYPQRLKTVFETRTEDIALSSEVDQIVSVPVIPALKQAMAAMTGNAEWEHVRAPLRPLDPAARARIAELFTAREGGS